MSNTFTSLYDYNKVSYLATISNHSLVSKENKISALREGNDYNKFFGEYKPYWMTLVCDGFSSDGSLFSQDKIFNTIEYRADMFNFNTSNHPDINEPVFTTIASWNGYQAYQEFNINAVRKFNIWRAVLPRASYIKNGILTTTRDRIRGTYCFIKLKYHSLTDNNRMILHDLMCYYTIK